jgi:hypothetical protein
MKLRGLRGENKHQIGRDGRMSPTKMDDGKTVFKNNEREFGYVLVKPNLVLSIRLFSAGA